MKKMDPPRFRGARRDSKRGAKSGAIDAVARKTVRRSRTRARVSAGQERTTAPAALCRSYANGAARRTGRKASRMTTDAPQRARFRQNATRSDFANPFGRNPLSALECPAMTTATADGADAVKGDAMADSGSPDGKGDAAQAWPYRFDIVPLDRLFVDESYQRPLTSFVQRIVRDFDPALIGTLVVSDRATSADAALKVAKNARDRYAAIDGQTRMEALRELKHDAAPCVVFEHLTRGDEASLFARLQTQRRGMATYMRFRAALVADDPEAVAIEAVARKHRYQIGTGSAAGLISAISALESAYRRELLDRVLGTIRIAWPDREEGDVSGEMIRGLTTFFQRTRNVDDNRLHDRLAMTTPSVLRHRASALREGQGGSGNAPGYMADAILAEYMRRERRAS